MALGRTVEGFDYNLGDSVHVARLREIPQPKLRIATEDAVTDTDLPKKFRYQPEKITVVEQMTEACWRRFSDCWTHCESANRQLR